MTEKITSNQENHIEDLLRIAVRALGLSKDEAQEIIKAGGVMQAEVKEVLKKLAITNKRFGPAVKEFAFTIPADYNHDSQLDTFAEKTKKLPSTYYFNDNLTSANFAKATNKLEPGKTYKVKIFPILATVTSEDCMNFLAKQNAILVGGQGVTLLQAEMPNELPVGKWTVSFDEKDALWTDGVGGRGVPGVNRLKGDVFGVGLVEFKSDWNNDAFLLCFCDA